MDDFFVFWGGPEVLLIAMIVMIVETLANHLECMKHVHTSSLVLPTWLFRCCFVFAIVGCKLLLGVHNMVER